MKRSIQYILLFGLPVLMAGCTKNVEEPNFDVTVAKTTFKVGEAITFDITGNPDNITFFSGESGFKYEFKNRTSAPGKPTLQFTTLNDMGVKNNIKLLIATDLGTPVDTNAVKLAKWTDITSKAIFSTGTDNTASGVIDLTEYAASGKPANIAFKYTDVKSTTRQNRWVIRTFNVNNTTLTDNSTYPLATLADAGWQAVDFKNFAAGWSITTVQLIMSGGVANSADNEDWVVTRPIDLNFVKRDIGVAIKTLSSQLSQYQYTYPVAGTYNVTFDAANVHYNGSKEQTKTFSITITP
ncbi:MAG: DUF5017 domain-containing protein [Bacteroidota bacterium]